MKLGEIKIEALKLMFANYNHDITIADIGQYYLDETYGSYLINMPGAINRCLSVIENKDILPSKRKVLEPSMGLASGNFIRFDLFAIIPDLYLIDRIVREGENGEYCGNYEYQLEGDNLVLVNDNAKYIVVYKPQAERITQDSADEVELDIPNNIACHIPYFIKGDLFREDEPNEASEARNWFEQAMAEIQIRQAGLTNKVENVYSQADY